MPDTPVMLALLAIGGAGFYSAYNEAEDIYDTELSHLADLMLSMLRAEDQEETTHGYRDKNKDEENINPDIVVQQGQGATNFGLSAALTGKITIKNGRVEQNNFYDYTVLRMADAPSIEIHIIPSSEPPTGIGEAFTPPIAPAVGNAIFRLTGKRVRSLPFSDALA